MTVTTFTKYSRFPRRSDKIIARNDKTIFESFFLVMEMMNDQLEAHRSIFAFTN